jgi:23S rRNA (adenine1618-N6)-methyltransferase
MAAQANPHPRPPSRPGTKPGLHPRNRHQGRYDFPRLVAACPELARHVAPNPYGDLSIDFSDPVAVTALNRAILKVDYGVEGWTVPAGYLCPPIPGRADCIHHLADLLGGEAGAIPRGPGVRVLAIGVGANCVYPLLGHREYGWRFLGSDIDPGALASASAILAANPGLAGAIRLRLQPRPERILEGLLEDGERFELTLCNPPFHASAAEARAGSERKWRNLGRARPGAAPVLNFGGQGAELWCPGGEAGFLGRLIRESAPLGERCLWFSSLVSSSAHLPGVYAALKAAGAKVRRTIAMGQGQKVSRIVAWTFLDEDMRKRWLRGLT